MFTAFVALVIGALPAARSRAPFPYSEEEITYTTDDAGIEFTGTLTIPETVGPFPAVLMISGSGAQDRDEALVGHRLFLIIAGHLSRIGIAILRGDDRQGDHPRAERGSPRGDLG